MAAHKEEAKITISNRFYCLLVMLLILENNKSCKALIILVTFCFDYTHVDLLENINQKVLAGCCARKLLWIEIACVHTCEWSVNLKSDSRKTIAKRDIDLRFLIHSSLFNNQFSYAINFYFIFSDLSRMKLQTRSIFRLNT